MIGTFVALQPHDRILTTPMKNCLLCNDEFEGSDPICPKCTSEHLAASVYRDEEEEAGELAAQAQPRIGLSPSLESVSRHGMVTPSRPGGLPPVAKKNVSGPQGP